MCVPSASGGASATASDSSFGSVVKPVRTLSSGPKTTIATGRSSLRSARNALAAAIAPSIGLPSMLLEASMRRMAPLDSPGGCTPSPTTGPPFSVIVSCSVVSGCVFGSSTTYARSGNAEPGASEIWIAAALCPMPATGAMSAASAALASPIRTRRFTLLHPCALRAT